MMTIRHLIITTTIVLFSALLMGVQAQTPPIEVTTDNDRVQFSTQGQAMHVEVFSRSGELVFEQDSAAGQSVQWQIVNEKGVRVADGVYLATIAVSDSSGKRRKRIEQIIVNTETQPKEDLSAKSDGSMQVVSFRSNSQSPILTVGNTVSRTAISAGGAIDTTTQYAIGNPRALSVLPDDNTFAGDDAGDANTSGYHNSFFGFRAGWVNTRGSHNSFFGAIAGFRNINGVGNSFFGQNAGSANVSGGSNAFFGINAGSANTTSSDNSFFGASAGRLTTGDRNSFFGSHAGGRNTIGGLNSFFGFFSGEHNTAGSGNAYFGAFAGESNTTGDRNASFGTFAGRNNQGGHSNSFFGFQAGQANTSGNHNAFFGTSAGLSNRIGFENAFFGTSSGQANNGNRNSFFGVNAGFANLTGANNSFLGASAGVSNTSGSRNTFVGLGAGNSNRGGNDNTFIGHNAAGSAELINATAIGANANVTEINSLVLGSIAGVNGATANTRVGIGTTAPQSPLHVKGYIQLPFVNVAPLAVDCTVATAGRMVIVANGTSGTQLHICGDTSAAPGLQLGWVIK